MSRRTQQTEEKEEEDSFISLLQSTMEASLKLSSMDDKDRNSLFANCIKFIAVKHKLKSGDDGDYFDRD